MDTNTLRKTSTAQRSGRLLVISTTFATVSICAFALNVVAPEPGSVGTPAPNLELGTGESAAFLARLAPVQLQQAGDNWLVCFYDALASLGRPVDEPRHQRVGQVCHRQ